MNGFQVAPAEIEAVLHGHPAVLDCAVFGVADERAGEVPVAAVQLDPARPVADGRARRQLVADSLATYKHLRHVVVVDADPAAARRARCCAARCATSGRRVAGRPDGAPDGRPPLARAAGAARLRRPGGRPARPARRRPSSTTPSGRRSSTPRSPRRAGASCGRPTTDGAPLASGGRGGDRRRGARPGPGRRRLPRPDAGRRAAPAGRRARRPRRPRPSSSPPTLRSVAVAVDGAVAGRRRGHRRRRAPTPALLLVPRPDGHRLAQVALPSGRTGADLTRPSAGVDPATAGDAGRRRRARSRRRRPGAVDGPRPGR